MHYRIRIIRLHLHLFSGLACGRCFRRTCFHLTSPKPHQPKFRLDRLGVLKARRSVSCLAASRAYMELTSPADKRDCGVTVCSGTCYSRSAAGHAVSATLYLLETVADMWGICVRIHNLSNGVYISCMPCAARHSCLCTLFFPLALHCLSCLPPNTQLRIVT